MTTQKFNSDTIKLPPEYVKKLKGKEFITILTEEGLLLKTISRDAVHKARGMLTNPELTVKSFLKRKREDNKLER